MDQDQPKHGEPGHKCRSIDASDAEVIIILREHTGKGHFLPMFTADTWMGRGADRRAAARILRDIADSWEEEAEEAEIVRSRRAAQLEEMIRDIKAEAAEEAAVQRAREWNS